MTLRELKKTANRMLDKEVRVRIPAGGGSYYLKSVGNVYFHDELECWVFRVN